MDDLTSKFASRLLPFSVSLYLCNRLMGFSGDRVFHELAIHQRTNHLVELA